MPSSQTSLSNSNDSASKMFQASTSNCNYAGELNENINWYSDSVIGTELNRPGPQNEWWTEFMAEDWKEILNDDDVSVATHSQPLVTGEVVQVQGPAELAESQPRLSIIPQLTSQQTHAKNPTNQNSGKPRMRWTQELHERFIDAVNKLGGSDKATPKAVLKIMKVDDLTIYHVKSHLQKYRTARYRPDLPEDTGIEGSQSPEVLPAIDLKSSLNLTEALRLQLELQKKLHEQLEIQRNLQIKIEEQGKYLQSLIEQQQGNPNSPTVTENGDKTQNEGNPKSENEV